MSKDKIYNCINCQKKCRVKEYTPELADLKLCPQCYTKEIINNNIK